MTLGLLWVSAWTPMRFRSPTLFFLARTALAMPFGILHHTSKVPKVPDGPAESAEEFWAAMFVSAGLVLAGGVFAGCAAPFFHYELVS
jgi:hypothetical protein